MQIANVEPPTFPDSEGGGRKSYRVTLADGSTVYAGDGVGPKLNVGDTYDNLEINDGQFGNKWLNWKKANDGAPNQPEPPPPVPSPTPPQPAPAPNAGKVKDQTPANIWIQGITQQAVASGVHDPAAVYQWAVDNYENFRTRKAVTDFPKRKPDGEAPF